LITAEAAKELDLPTVSPSQIKTWRDCPRKWGFEKLDGLRGDPGQGAIIGGAVHKVLEAYFRGEPLPNYSQRVLKIARAMIDHYTMRGWTAPLPGSCIEREFWLLRDGWLYHGLKDINIRRAGRRLIVDHKTSSNPRKYGLTDATLPHDEQALIYAIDDLESFDLREVDLEWTYARNKGAPAPYTVSCTLHRSFVEDKMGAIDVTARDIVRARRDAERAINLEPAGHYQPPDKSACGKYGGCPFIQFCPRRILVTDLLPPDDDENDIQQEQDMSALDQLKKKIKKAPPRKEDLEKTGQAKPATARKLKREKPADPKDSKKKRSALSLVKGDKKSGRDPQEVLDKYDQIEQESEDSAIETKAPQVNAPEVDNGNNNDELVAASESAIMETEGGKPILDKEELRRQAEEIAAKNAGKAEPLDAAAVMKRLYATEDKLLRLSVKRSNDSGVYVQNKTLQTLEANGKITWFKDGQVAVVQAPDATERHGDVWLQCLQVAAQYTDGNDRDEVIANACHFFEAYREQFG